MSDAIASGREQGWIVPDWPAPPGVQAVVSTRHGPGVSKPPFDRFNLGSRCGDDALAVTRNRQSLQKALSLPVQPRWLKQTHGIQVFDADQRGESNDEPLADAVITSQPGQPLAILTADCLPVLFCAVDGSVVGAAHAGWRGLLAGVLENTVAAMRKKVGAAVLLMAWIGPGIAAASYEVGEDVHDAFAATHANAMKSFTASRPGHWLCDLPALARHRLRDIGIASIHGGHFDTFTDKRLYSYRRDGAASGRFASLIWREAAG